MKEDLTRLYSQVIKTHNHAPFHFEKKPQADRVLRAYNPVCGDRFELFVNLKDGRILDIHFHGFGCAISKASTSVLIKSIDGKSVSEAIGVCDLFLRFLNRKSGEDFSMSEEFLAFSGVHDFPERYDCAALSWREAKRFLEES